MNINEKNVDIDGTNEDVKKTYPNLKPFVKGGFQPSSQSKINGWTKRREKMEFKESMEDILNLPSRTINCDGVDIQLNTQDEIVKKLVELAQKGNLKAIEILAKILDWFSVQKTENINLEIPFKIITEFKDFRENINKLNDGNLK